ncbi:MAG: hypothetical protein L0I29_10165 [Hyphomicrobiales bacterium]|nr:hypothetical protein [Hyphomicrobiales bacterium]
MILSRNLALTVLPASCAAVLLLAACQSSAPPPDPNGPLDITYSQSEFRRYERPGDATLAGQAFLHDQGDVVPCTGQPVLLFPHTRSFERMVELARMKAHPLFQETVDPRLNAVTRHTVCGTGGNFTFRNLPRGRWYVFTRVRWSAGDAGMTGGDLIGEADTSAGTGRIVLDDRNRI